MKKRIHFSKKVRQFKAVLKRLKKNQFNTQQEKDSLIEKAERLYYNLSSIFSLSFFKKSMAGLSLSILMSIGVSEVNAQITFGAEMMNPFSITATGVDLSNPTFADLDGDGDLDMLSGSYSYDYYYNYTYYYGYGEYTGDFYYFENTGTNLAPSFAAPVVNPFNLDFSTDTSTPEFVDLDGDGDMDIVSGEFYGSMFYYENIGTPTAPNFAAAQTDPFGYTSPGFGGILHSTFGDFDNDGDLDMFGSISDVVYYFENTGSSSSPMFAAGVSDTMDIDITNNGAVFPDNVSITSADLDNDGDIDLLPSFSYYGNVVFDYLENVGSATVPDYDSTFLSNPFGLSPTHFSATPTFVDLDGDGDMDIMSGDSGGNFYFFENTTPPPPPNAIPTSMDTAILINEDVAYNFSEAEFNFTDADTSDTLSTVKIVTTTSIGSLTLSGSAVSAGQDIAATDLSNLTFTPLANEFGANYDSFTFQVSDGEDFSVDTFMLTIHVNPVNDAPTSADNAVTTDEDVAYTFAASDFAFADIDTGDMLSGVRIETATSVGDLTLSGAAVSAGDDIAVADIPNLVFTPVMDEFGMNYDSFTFKVNDGTANSDSVYTMQINVSEVVDTTTDTTDTTGIRMLESIESLNAYPNPVSDQLNLSFVNETNDVAIVEIFDINGKLAIRNEFAEKGNVTKQLDLSNLNKGVYVLKVSIADKTSTIKLIN